jgi:hypothetical protein
MLQCQSIHIPSVQSISLTFTQFGSIYQPRHLSASFVSGRFFFRKGERTIAALAESRLSNALVATNTTGAPTVTVFLLSQQL